MNTLFAPYFFLVLSMVFLWISFLRKAWYVPFILSILLGLWGHRLNLWAGPSLGVLFLSLYFSLRPDKFHVPQVVFDSVFFILGTLFLFHLVPGFCNWKAVSSYQMSSISAPYAIYLNFDKGSLGLFLLALLPTLLCRKAKDWLLSLKMGSLCTLIAVIVLLLSGWALRYIAWDPKIAPFWRIWIFCNLFLVVIPEEAFFRGFILTKIAHYCQRWKANNLIALLLSSLIFGLFHFPGGWSYVLLASFAGVIYGLSYLWSGKLESAIFTHFMVNTIHFFFFSYPYLAK